jgi:hypothetical protein
VYTVSFAESLVSELFGFASNASAGAAHTEEQSTSEFRQNMWFKPAA